MNEAISLFKAPAYQLRGVRGWLLLFCIGCLVAFLQALGNALYSHHWFHILCWTTLAALEISCCTLLWLKSPRGLNILYLLFGASLIGIFIEGNPIYPEAGFREKTHIQVAVRNPQCIKGVFRIPGLEK